MKKWIMFAGVAAFQAVAQAQGHPSTTDAGYFEIGQVQVQELKVEKLNRRLFNSAAIGSDLCSSTSPQGRGSLFSHRARAFDAAGGASGTDLLSPLNTLEIAVDKIINLGKKVWDIVQAGKPVVNMKSDVATALPEGARCWLDLQTWQAPEARTYSVTYKNIYGADVVTFQYRIVYVAGGSIDGKGRYIGYAALEPSNVNVAWGYTFGATGSAPTVYNMGTRQDPIAGMNLNMNYTVSTPFRHMEASQAYFITGNGEFKKLD